MSDEPGDVEGHGSRIHFRDEQGNELDIPGDRITKVWIEDDVEGHGSRYGGLTPIPDDVEGHGSRFHGRDAEGNEREIDLSKVTKLAFTDDDGNEQEVEGHMPLARRLDQEGDTEGHLYKR